MPHARRSRELNPASRAPRYPRRRMTAGANDIGAAHASTQALLADARPSARIEKTLAWTQGRLGVALDTDPWVGPLYQNANRLAHLCWLRSRGVRAWLAHLLFTDDPHGPTSADEWEHAVRMPTRRSGLTESQFPLPGMWCYQHEQKTAPSALLQNPTVLPARAQAASSSRPSACRSRRETCIWE
jgi:hypothetical protein